MQDDPSWSVTLDDGAVLTQGEGTLFADLPMERIRELRVTFGQHHHAVELANGRRPIYFSKTQLALNPISGDETDRRRVVCVGWQETVKGVNVKSLCWLTDTGLVIHAPDDPGEW